ncbi:MAG: ATP-dependent Clp protease ATP-binding subunit [Deltaproteobacteria bacterium]|nr:ATP-dependent Clp protease ATP-binding subunit [Deltaproteobacteria bacterium]MBW2307112.1 ATP-dependent Clp protease ATP-binding subunit [Deltaproteobacteria bacterium]
MIDLSNYKNYLSDKAHEVLKLAIEESHKREHYYLGVEHIFLALTNIEDDLFNEVINHLGVNPKQMVDGILREMDNSKQFMGERMKVLTPTKTVLKLAWENAQSSGRKLIEPIDLFLAIFHDGNNLPSQVLAEMGVEPARCAETIAAQLRRLKEREKEVEKRFQLPPTLNSMGANLNRLAYLGKLPPIIGRDQEIDQMIEILCHKERSNSVMIIGEPGVGKTALVEGLAQRLEFEPERIPRRLRGQQIVNLQMNNLVAGTVLRGMFEERIQNVVKELKEKKNLILFVDEAHTIIGAGMALGVPSDAANILKSTLSRGEIQMIGCTTASEYKQFIQEDEALARRFRVVTVQEPNLEESREILIGVRPRLEQNYSVSISDEAINAAIEMAQRYQRGHKLPDKAINWLDTASVKVEINKPYDVVSREDILEVISQETRTPIDMVYRDTVDRFTNMEEALARRIVGQKEAIRAVARQLRLNKGPLKENFDRPDGVLLFLGPTGVGKTELSKALAEFLFGDDKKMIRIDMSEYRDGIIGVDKLIGMPRGIVGSEKGGILTNQIRDNPFTVVLLDEMEKASSYVLNLFLQVFDEGWLSDGRGKRVYFSDAVIIMTSNLGSNEFKRYQKPMGFLTDSHELGSIKREVMRQVENSFSPEFINRIDDIIVFSPLSEEEVQQITGMYLDDIRKTMQESNRDLIVSEDAVSLLARTGFSIKYGARFLKRTIDEKIKIPITLNWKEGRVFKVDVENDKIVITWE